MALLAATVAGCANLAHGSTQKIRVVSEPPGAQVTVDSDPVPYDSPATITLKRGQDHVLVFRKEGFNDYSAELTRTMSGAVFGSLLLGGVSGVMTDVGSGAAYDLGHANMVGDTLTVHLKAKAPAIAGPSSAPPSAARPESASIKDENSVTPAPATADATTSGPSPQ